MLDSYLEKIGLLAHCLLVPVAWGLLVEWVFHVVRTRKRGRRGRPVHDLELEEPTGWSGGP